MTMDCETCGSPMPVARSTKRFCSPRCRVAAARALSVTETASPALTPCYAKKPAGDLQIAPQTRSTSKLWDGPPLQGDDYPLEYYADGYPKLPAYLDRRRR